jgi:hypothetical protein
VSGGTVKDDLRDWNLNRVIWVVDRGFCSAASRRYLQRGGGHYIMGEKLRSDSLEAKHALARAGRYRTVAGNLRVKEVRIDDGTMRDRFVICHNPERAARDAEVRARIVALLQAKIADSDRLSPGKRAELAGALKTKPAFNRLLRAEVAGARAIPPLAQVPPVVPLCLGSMAQWRSYCGSSASTPEGTTDFVFGEPTWLPVRHRSHPGTIDSNPKMRFATGLARLITSGGRA